MPARRRSILTLAVALVGAVLSAAPARAIHFCLEHAVSLDTRDCDTIVTGKIVSNDVAPNSEDLLGRRDTGRIVFTVTNSLQGAAAGDITASWEGTGKETSPAHDLKPGERLVLLLKKTGDSYRYVSAMYLENNADEKDAIASYAEIAPHIALFDAAGTKDAPPPEKLSAAIIKLAASKNRFTLRTLAYFVVDSLANTVDPAPYTEAIIACLHSEHFAPICSAAAWAAHSSDRALLPHLKQVAETKAALTKTLAFTAIDAIEAAAAQDPAATRAAAAVDARPISEFKPSRDAFAFPNAFPGLPLKTTFLDRAGQLYGLCGGMSFAAADFFLHRKPTPDTAAVPQKGSALWTYLFKRQADTLESGVAEKFILWTNLEDSGRFSVPALTVFEVSAAKKLLDAKRPAILGLIVANDPANVFANHQILAYRYETKGDTIIFHTYDPNFPRDDDRVLIAEPVIQSGNVEIFSGEKIPAMNIFRGRADTPKSLVRVRGFFVNPYSPGDPEPAIATQPK